MAKRTWIRCKCGVKLHTKKRFEFVMFVRKKTRNSIITK